MSNNETFDKTTKEASEDEPPELKVHTVSEASLRLSKEINNDQVNNRKVRNTNSSPQLYPERKHKHRRRKSPRRTRSDYYSSSSTSDSDRGRTLKAERRDKRKHRKHKHHRSRSGRKHHNRSKSSVGLHRHYDSSSSGENIHINSWNHGGSKSSRHLGLENHRVYSDEIERRSTTTKIVAKPKIKLHQYNTSDEDSGENHHSRSRKRRRHKHKRYSSDEDSGEKYRSRSKRKYHSRHRRKRSSDEDSGDTSHHSRSKRRHHRYSSEEESGEKSRRKHHKYYSSSDSGDSYHRRRRPHKKRSSSDEETSYDSNHSHKSHRRKRHHSKYSSDSSGESHRSGHRRRKHHHRHGSRHSRYSSEDDSGYSRRKNRKRSTSDEADSGDSRHSRKSQKEKSPKIHPRSDETSDELNVEMKGNSEHSTTTDSDEYDENSILKYKREERTFKSKSSSHSNSHGHSSHFPNLHLKSFFKKHQSNANLIHHPKNGDECNGDTQCITAPLPEIEEPKQRKNPGSKKFKRNQNSSRRFEHKMQKFIDMEAESLVWETCLEKPLMLRLLEFWKHIFGYNFEVTRSVFVDGLSLEFPNEDTHVWNLIFHLFNRSHNLILLEREFIIGMCKFLLSEKDDVFHYYFYLVDWRVDEKVDVVELGEGIKKLFDGCSETNHTDSEVATIAETFFEEAKASGNDSSGDITEQEWMTWLEKRFSEENGDDPFYRSYKVVKRGLVAILKKCEKYWDSTHDIEEDPGCVGVDDNQHTCQGRLRDLVYRKIFIADPDI
eukprot:TRINITY_DN9741_c0_g1_i1.p1 TRINITY_DN9741_c0_g1~~TRINITY_DN9741_c0_g1_i1.p1  ORF type:complete len:773 (-),score=155.13 TRINITY_DN9741_c0_g1_i1:75-2393(-)